MTASIPGFRNKKTLLKRIGVLALLGVAVHLLLPQITTLENSWRVLLQLLIWAVALAISAQILSYVSFGYLMQKTFAIAQISVSWIRCILIVIGSASIGMVAGGTVGSTAAIYHWIGDNKNRKGGATLASLLPSLFNNLTLVLLSIFGLIHLLALHDLTRSQLIGFSATLVLLGFVVSAVVLAVHYRERSIAIINRFASFISKLSHKSYNPENIRKEATLIFTAWDDLWHGKWYRLVLGAFLNVFFDMLTLFFLFLSSGEKISVGVLLSGYALPLLLGKMAFILPGGVGVVETSMAAIYSELGVPKSTAVVVILSYRLISFWIPIILGFPVAGFLQRNNEGRD